MYIGCILDLGTPVSIIRCHIEKLARTVCEIDWKDKAKHEIILLIGDLNSIIYSLTDDWKPAICTKTLTGIIAVNITGIHAPSIAIGSRIMFLLTA